MFWLQEDELCWRVYASPANEGRDDAAGSVEFENDTQMWLGMDYTKPDDSKAGCAVFGPFISEEEAQAAVEKSILSVSRTSDARTASTS